MTPPSLLVCRDSETLAVKAANFVADCAQDAVRECGRFSFVLSGGSTPEQMYAILARRETKARVVWSKIDVFFGDERFVPHSDERSNYAMARRALLAEVPIQPSQVFAVPTHFATAAEAAAAYGKQLADYFAIPLDSPPPVFDLILLGVGDDGHTASLFPGSPTLMVEDRWVTSSRPGALPPFVERITLTFPILNAARRVAFLVAGEKKAAVLQDIFSGQVTRDRCPAIGVRPVHGAVTWFVDAAASKRLTH